MVGISDEALTGPDAHKPENESSILDAAALEPVLERILELTRLQFQILLKARSADQKPVSLVEVEPAMQFKAKSSVLCANNPRRSNRRSKPYG